MTSGLTGKELYTKWKLQQGSYLVSDCFPAEWIEYRPSPEMRQKGFKKNIRLLIQTQNCDLTAKDDLEPEIELLPLVRKSEKQTFHRNFYAQSSRTLHLQIGEQFFEGKVRSTITLPKQRLLEWLEAHREKFTLDQLTPENLRTLIAWKANRYQRAALPDRFNHAFGPVFERYADSLGKVCDEQGASYLRALYLYLNTLEESEAYQFALLGLLKHDTPDVAKQKVDDLIEELIQGLEQTPGFTLAENPSLVGNAERETQITVAQLSQYIKVNLDYLSLKEGEQDLGPELN